MQTTLRAKLILLPLLFATALASAQAGVVSLNATVDMSAQQGGVMGFYNFASPARIANGDHVSLTVDFLGSENVTISGQSAVLWPLMLSGNNDSSFVINNANVNLQGFSGTGGAVANYLLGTQSSGQAHIGPFLSNFLTSSQSVTFSGFSTSFDVQSISVSPQFYPSLSVQTLGNATLQNDTTPASQEFLDSFDNAQSTISQFGPGASLTREDVIRSRDTIQDVLARRAAIELEYQQTTRAIWTDFWIDVADASLASFEALGCVATAGVGCAAIVGAEYAAEELLEWGTERVLCERGDVNCEVGVNLAYFTVNPTFESFNFDVSYSIRPDRSYLFDWLDVGDTIGLKMPLFGDSDALTLVTLAGIEGSSVTLHFDGVRQVANAVPEPGTLALFVLGLAGLAASRRRKQWPSGALRQHCFGVVYYLCGPSCSVRSSRSTLRANDQ